MKISVLLFILIYSNNFLNSQCQSIIFPNQTNNGAKICLEGYPSASNNDFCFENENGNLKFFFNQYNGFVFTKEPKLGIGLSIPQEMLDVQGNGVFRGNFFKLAPTVNDAVIQRTTPGNLVICSGGGNSSIYLNYAQDYGSGNQGVRLFDGGITNYTSLKMIQTRESLNNSFFGGTLLIAPSNAKVVIGYETEEVFTPDGYKLFVTGGILSEKFKAALKNTSQWSDHVFEKDYALMPLNQVEDYIKANKHLPNIPSADELVKEGLDLADMQAKQMEKIEELTLYLIEMKKDIEKLKAENASLKEQLSKN